MKTQINLDVDSDDDDRPIGHVLSRREVLALLGATGLAACTPAALSGASPTNQAASSTAAATSVLPTAAATAGTTTGAAVATPSCIVRPALTEGPYFVDEKLNRSDVRVEPSTNIAKPGTEFRLTFNVARVASSGCTALANAQVDIWHCDAAGVYSDASDPSFNTRGQKFLRGYQNTDASGKATFVTIYPGWYRGRAVHIHFKIRTTSGSQTSDFTSQLFFEDSLSAEVFATAPYSSQGSGWLRNAQDGIYTGGGSNLVLRPTKSGNVYSATFDIGLA
jgi:protocatechuate 3,4-dioxygenase beta subunit